MTDQIIIKDLLLRTIIGVKADERVNKQDVIINVVMEANLRAAGRSDEIADTVNYRTITKNIIAMIETSEFLLVEKAANEVARICLDDDRVLSVEVRIEKPGALRFARSVGVSVKRTRADYES